MCTQYVSIFICNQFLLKTVHIVIFVCYCLVFMNCTVSRVVLQGECNQVCVCVCWGGGGAVRRLDYLNLFCYTRDIV